MCPEAYDFFPKTWILPFESNNALRYLKENGTEPDIASNHRCIIVKPSGGAQGKGIHLAIRPYQIRQNEDAVAQVYVTNPLLLDGLKFDLRIYALVTCCDPLRVLLYREGLVRLCTKEYVPPHMDNVDCTFMHLTNYAVNKHNPEFVENNFEEEGDASKRSLAWLWDWMRNRGIDPSEVRFVTCYIYVYAAQSCPSNLNNCH